MSKYTLALRRGLKFVAGEELGPGRESDAAKFCRLCWNMDITLEDDQTRSFAKKILKNEIRHPFPRSTRADSLSASLLGWSTIFLKPWPRYVHDVRCAPSLSQPLAAAEALPRAGKAPRATLHGRVVEPHITVRRRPSRGTIHDHSPGRCGLTAPSIRRP